MTALVEYERRSIDSFCGTERCRAAVQVRGVGAQQCGNRLAIPAEGPALCWRHR